eukprot:CAMPEP_0196785982 /NCGR_PEP_ID=MMETSP1104-20130614/20468_1 /TAXON_ID=33652 /ORGANISM="Cafeteria sp., Strain Caron Lab Isolate" /LENGTH=46 /DNA_ID= /DNA_START= /DNA_END= /DNA_ORIENTATION=
MEAHADTGAAAELASAVDTSDRCSAAATDAGADEGTDADVAGAGAA